MTDDANSTDGSPHDSERVEGLVRRATVMSESLQNLSRYQHHAFENYRGNRELRDVDVSAFDETDDCLDRDD